MIVERMRNRLRLNILIAACALLCAPRTSPASPGATRHAVAKQGESVTIAASGDILLDRDVARKVRGHGYAYPFAHVRSALWQADIAFANLECPLSSRPIRVHKPVAFAAPPAMAQCLTDGGLDIVSIANNHAMDCGQAGLADTMDALRLHDIRWCGAGATPNDALTPTIIAVRGVRIAFVGFCEFLPEDAALRNGGPAMAMATEENVRTAVAAARKQADIVVASFHWGIEFTVSPTERQRRLAHAAAEAGADLVFGHHPHVLQGIEVIRAHSRVCLVAYSLGNFVFDQHLASSKDPESTVLLTVAVNRKGLQSASFVPITIRNCAPRLATGTDAQRIADDMSALSAGLGTSVRNRRIDFTSSVSQRISR